MKAGLCDEFPWPKLQDQTSGVSVTAQQNCTLLRFMFIIDATITENRQRILRNAKTSKGIGDYNHRQTKQLRYSSGCFPF